MQPLYYVRHVDGSYSVADPQPRLFPTSGLPDTPKAATEFGLETVNAGDDSAEAAYARQQ